MGNTSGVYILDAILICKDDTALNKYNLEMREMKINRNESYFALIDRLWRKIRRKRKFKKSKRK